MTKSEGCREGSMTERTKISTPCDFFYWQSTLQPCLRLRRVTWQKASVPENTLVLYQPIEKRQQLERERERDLSVRLHD